MARLATALRVVVRGRVLTVHISNRLQGAVSAAEPALVALSRRGSNLNRVSDAAANSRKGQNSSTNTATVRNVTYTLGALNRTSVTDTGVVTNYGTPSGIN